MNKYFESSGTIGFTCDVCGRELQSCTIVNGMKFCAKCYQETYGNNTSDFVDLLNREMEELIKLYKCKKEPTTAVGCQKLIEPFICQIEKLKFANYQKDKKMADLEAKLAESEKSKESYRLQNDDHQLKLLQFYSRLGVEAFGKDIHEKALETLMIMKEQLAEKEKEIEINKNALKKLIKNCNTVKCENKISFAVEQLNLLYKTLTTEDVWRAMQKGWWLNNGKCLQLRQIIDNQIKQLKEGK